MEQVVCTFRRILVSTGRIIYKLSLLEIGCINRLKDCSQAHKLLAIFHLLIIGTTVLWSIRKYRTYRLLHVSSFVKHVLTKDCRKYNLCGSFCNIGVNIVRNQKALHECSQLKISTEYDLEK